MTQFLTQPLDENLQVLLIHDGSILAQKLSQFIDYKSVAVAEIRLKQLVNNHELRAKIQQVEFYKIILVTGFNQTINQQRQQLIVNFLSERTEPKIIILRVLGLIKSGSNLFNEWLETQQNQSRFYNRLKSQLHNRKFILGKDVVEPGKNLSPPLYSLFKNVKQYSQLIDPQIDLNLQTTLDFFNSFKKELFSPKNRNFLIKGLTINTSEICQKTKNFYQLYYQQSLTISLLTVESKNTQLNSDLISATSDSDFSKAIDLKVRVLPELKLKAVDLRKIQTQTAAPLEKAQPKKIVKSVKEKKVGENREEDQSTITRESKPQKKQPVVDELEQEFSRLFLNQRKNKKIDRRVKKANTISRIIHKTRHKKLIFFGGLILVIAGLIVGTTLGGFYLTYGQAKSDFINQLSQFESFTNSYRSKIDESRWLSILAKLQKPLNKTIQLDQFQAAADIVQFQQKINQTFQLLNQKKDLSTAFYQHLWGNSNQDIREIINQINQLDQQAYDQLSLLQAKLENFPSHEFKSDQQQQLELAKNQIKDLRKKLAKQQKLDPLLSSLFGLEGKRVYLVLLQDNLELRPTGGFIQAVGLITVKDGLILDKQVFNVYQLDQKLAANLAAPSEIKTLLGEERLFLRDANWNPDFPATAKRTSWFVRETVNQQVDAVIGLNYHLIKDLLEHTGEIKIPKYDQTIDHKNLFERLLFYAQEDDQIQNRQSYQLLIFEALLNKLASLSENQVKDLLTSLYQSLEQKQTLISLTSDLKQENFKSLDWSGQIINPECPTQFISNKCLVDSFYQVDANVGINKVNNLVDRSIDHQISFTKNKIQNTRTIVYKNRARSDVWPLGIYKNYIRFYLNPDAKLTNIQLDGQAVSEDLIVNYIDQNRQVFGVLIEVKPGKTSKLVLNYSFTLPKQERFSYLLFDQKQPGLEQKPIDFVVEHSPTLVPQLIAPKAQVEDQMIFFNKERNRHTFIGIEFEKFNN